MPETQNPSLTISDWVAQIEASLTEITGVRLEATEAGLQIVLDTAEGNLATPATQTVGNALIADIPYAVLVLPEGGSFEQFGPAEGIALVAVTNEPGDRVRVAITGTDAPPVVAVTATGLAVILGEAVVGAEDEAIQVVVTGEQDEGYNPSRASTATRTDTPLRDIPQSIQVVPRQVLEDRNVRSLFEAVETVSGVVDGADYNGSPAQNFIIRGFSQGGNFRNGYRDVNQYALTGVGTIEQVEVLRGPASVLFGAVEPGGIINVITRQPLSEPYYNLSFEAGNRELYQPNVDLSGPLTTDDTVLYRFIANYQSSNGFQDFVNTDLVTIAPSITLNFSDRTNLNLYYEYINFSGIFEQYTSALSDNTLLPRSFYQAYPNGAFVDNTTQKLGYVLNHELSDSWQLRNNFSITASQNDEEYTLATSVVDDRSLTQFAQEREFPQDNYFGQIDLLGEFSTGAISHRLLVGFDFNRNVEIFQRAIARNVPDLDIFAPNYNIPDFNYGPTSSTYTAIQSYGVYLQDQVDLLDNLKLLIGGRFDWVSVNETSNGDDSPEQNDTAFSPRVGLVYQPSDMVSLYASYSQSFLPTSGFSQDNQPFEPTRGTQYEVGVKTDFFDGNLSATLAAYQLTRSNVETPDPENPDFSIQVGEQRSRGIELDIGGEILPGWNLIASYAYTDARTTRDNAIEEGNRLTSVPENQASLWTTYEIQEGDLNGLGFGLGIFYVGERQGDLDNSFVLPNYLRTDAAVYYRRGQLNTAINIRNLFNTDYIRTSDGGNTFLRRGAPFTIVGSISWEF
ncbi:TonB-dependent siderophore receptor [Nodosilinea sp. LEGE 07298]|uniref:TonB-dependent siderophore receptor n=1 Tax=Nodosilinea sp. LEGE 07298 TaxID=2777970 RepID=UPI0018814D72|nr:TonB-dependent siderophore receptor [Nodosilinea sp. LEGE 07298]